MKVKDVMFQLNILNPELEIEFRAYEYWKKNSRKMNYKDLSIVEMRIVGNKAVLSNQCGVD